MNAFENQKMKILYNFRFLLFDFFQKKFTSQNFFAV